MTAQRTSPLEVGLTDLSIGEYSVGLAPCRTGEQVLAGYLDLIALVRADYPEEVRDEDLDTLVTHTGMERRFIETRVHLQLSAL